MTDQRDGPGTPGGRRGWLLAVGAVAAVAGVGGALWRHRPGGTAPGSAESLWEHRFARPEGGELDMAEFRGRPLLINFWATWCPPCVRELPEIDRFVAAHPDRLRAVGLAIDRPDAVREFLARQPVGFPVGLAALEGTELASQLGNSGAGLPFTALLDAGGAVVRSKMGETRHDDLVSWVRAL